MKKKVVRSIFFFKSFKKYILIHTGFEGLSLEDSSLQIQMLDSLDEGACVRQQDLDLPEPQSPTLHGKFSVNILMWFSLPQFYQKYSSNFTSFTFVSYRDMNIPFSQWTKEQVCGWLEDYGLGQYINLARQWVENGQTFLSATPQDFEKVIKRTRHIYF